jgi:hypothetical protein
LAIFTRIGGTQSATLWKVIPPPKASQACKWSTIEMFFSRERSQKITIDTSGR